MGDSVVGVDVGSFVIIGNSVGIGVGRVVGYNKYYGYCEERKLEGSHKKGSQF